MNPEFLLLKPVNIKVIIISVKVNNQELLIRKQNDSNATSKCIDFQNTTL